MSALLTDASPALLADGFVFAEGPRWRGDKLWLSDMHGEAVYTTTLAGETTLQLALPGKKPSGIGFLPDGAALIVSMAERQLIRLDPDGSTRVHADLGTLVEDELNDMVVTGDGTAFVGSYPTERDGGVLVRVAPDGRFDVVADGLDFPNGTVISPDGATLIVAESIGRRFTAFDVDASQHLSGRRVIATTPDAAPDGIALDAEGAIWAAFPLAHEFRRIVPGGEVTDRILMSERTPSACALGGIDRCTLFLLSATHWSAEALGGRRTSRVDTIRVGVAGAGIP